MIRCFRGRAETCHRWPSLAAAFGLALSCAIPWLPANGQWSSDAFGLFDPSLEPERSAWAGLQVSALGTESLVPPGGAVTALILMGEKSLLAANAQSMVLAIGLDAFGNLIPDGLVTRFTFTSAPMQDSISLNGLAHARLQAGERSGLYEVGAEIINAGAVDPIQSERQVYRIVADVRGVTLALAPQVGSGLQNTLNARIETQPLIDAYANPLGDGYGFRFVLRGDDGRITLLPLISTGTKAGAVLPTAYLSARQTLTAALLQAPVLREELTIAEGAISGTPALTAEYEPELGLMRLNWGPVRTSNGALMPDGTRLRLRIETANTVEVREEDIWIEKGGTALDLLVGFDALPMKLTFSSMLGEQAYEVRP